MVNFSKGRGRERVAGRERGRGRQRVRTVKICSEDMFVTRQMALQSSKSHTWKFWLSICNNKLLTVSVWVYVCVWVCICIHMRVCVYANTSKRLSQQRQSENCQLNKKRTSLHMLRYTTTNIHTYTYTHTYIHTHSHRHTCINGPCYVLPIFRCGFFSTVCALCKRSKALNGLTECDRLWREGRDRGWKEGGREEV